MARQKHSMDGNTAAAHVAYAYTEVAGIYPITPSSPMADYVDQWSAAGRKNIFGSTVKVVEMESEAGAAGTVHGSLGVGALTTTFTASQGLLLMIPNMYKIAGEQLPCVFDVSARTVSSHALNIFGDHSDVYACRQTGFAMLCETNPQEVMDLSPVAHCAALEGKTPFLNFFDGFRTSHEIQKIEEWDYEDLKDMCPMDAVEEFRAHALNPNHPSARGSHENGDIFFQHREACNSVYDALPAVVEKYMNKVNEKLGTNYGLFNYYGAPDAERVIIAMGSVNDVVEEVIDYLTAKGEKVGLIKVRLYRPWSSEAILKVIPKTAKKIAVLDRTKEPGSLGEPLFLDVATTLREAGLNDITLVGGRYGLGSKDTPPSSIFAVYKELEKDAPKSRFTIGIVDDVTNLSLETGAPIVTTPEGTTNCKFWGLGADGTVGANKNSIKIIGDHTDQYAQAYFEYDSKKSGGVTKSHLRFGHEPIHSTYYVTMADFVACHKTSYIKDFDIVSEIKPHGTFLLNTSWTGAELEEHLPNRVKRQIAEREINFYTIDATAIAMELGLGNRTNTVLQAAFFNLSGIIPIEDAVKYMKAAIVKSYSKKGQKIVDMNSAAVDKGVNAAVKINVPESWKTLADDTKAPDASLPHYIREIQIPVNKQAGDAIPVSEFMPYADGVTPSETSKYEKRGIAVKVPQWIPENCIGCNKCALVCPHAAIRPFLLNAEEEAAKPAAFVTKEAKGKGFEGLTFRMQVDPLDCQGCGACANVCPAKEKALVMELLDTQMPEQENWDHALTLSTKTNPMDKFTVRGSQFERPLYEFSGACAGCGEAPYMKLMSQLFGDRMFVTSATGCAYVVGSSTPSFPYVANEKGHGPANSNSLFEDNAEYALGMKLSIDQMRRQMAAHAEAVVASTSDAALKSALEAWLAEGDNGYKTRALSEAVVAALNATAETSDDIAFLKANKDALPKKSVWMYGGDGWAYDIGFGGLDHVLASGADVNVLVVDTEVYSNTGGQASKATQLGAVAQFANGGKRTGKKDLGAIAMTYGNVYVAQVAMGANEQHLITALKEAEAHHGPSILIAYAPCINHGISKGMSQAQLEEKLASECGYWPLWRYVPELKAEGKNPFILTSKEPNGQLLDFMMGETRFASLTRTFPETAKVLFAEAEEFCAQRYAKYKKLAEQ